MRDMAASREDRAITSVVIAGGGTAGWMSAALISRFVGPGVSVTLVESDEIGTVGVGEATIPTIKIFNDTVGVTEHDLIAETKATFKLAIRFEGWKQRSSYFHGFGAIAQRPGWAATHHYLLQTTPDDTGIDLGPYSINCAAAERDRFLPPVGQPDSPISELAYAYHFDAALYAGLLRARSVRNGVVRVEGRIGDVEQDATTGHVTALILEGGRRIAGELFIDCAGFRGLLINRFPAARFIDWSHWLPCDRALAVRTQEDDTLPSYTRAVAMPAGWRWRIPLQHRFGNGYVYSSSHCSDDQAFQELERALHPNKLDAHSLRFRAGRLAEPWIGNVVAVGLSSGFLEPLESTSIHLIQSHLVRLMTLFPDRRWEPTLAQEYNRQLTAEWGHVRDFLIAHYRVNDRTGAASANGFWRERRETPPPDTLAHRLRLFETTARVFDQSDELFRVQSWLQILLGQGLRPSAADPLALNRPHELVDRYLTGLAASITGCVDRMPSHAEYLSAMLSPNHRRSTAARQPSAPRRA